LFQFLVYCLYKLLSLYYQDICNDQILVLQKTRKDKIGIFGRS